MGNYYRKRIDPLGEFSIRTLRKCEELEEVRALWRKHQWFPNADIDFYIRLSSSNPGFIRPHVILLSRGEIPLTLLIGRIQDTVVQSKIEYKVVCRTQLRCLEIVYGGILGDLSRSTCDALVQELMEALRRGEADIVFLKGLRFRSTIHEVARQMPGFLFRDHSSSPSPHWAMTLPTSVDEFYVQRPKSLKKTIRLITNRMEKDFAKEWSVRCFQRPDETCAFWNGYVYKNIFIPTATGYDPVFRYYDPGMFLFLRVVEDLYTKGNIQSIDFGFGDADYKRRYCDQMWEEASVYIFSSQVRSLRLSAVMSLTSLISRTGEAVLKRFSLVTWVKSKWRRRLILKKSKSDKSVPLDEQE